jgi:RNA polymerase sigma factor (sigma-70 family)
MSATDLQAASRWVDDHGECLYRYALVRVRKPEVAEDLVQETFLATVRGYEKFGGRSSERSWLVGILKNKIVDHFRKVVLPALGLDVDDIQPKPIFID